MNKHLDLLHFFHFLAWKLFSFLMSKLIRFLTLFFRFVAKII